MRPYKEITALLVIDPYNDFISDGGKFWGRLKGVAEVNHCVPNMSRVLNASRQAELHVFYALHHRYRPGDYETWKYIAPIQKKTWSSRAFEDASWGGEIRNELKPRPGDIVATEHWCSSGFANTDLDVLLKRHGIHNLIAMGLVANTSRGHRSFRRGARLRCHGGEGRDCELLGRRDACRSRRQSSELRCDPRHG